MTLEFPIVYSGFVWYCEKSSMRLPWKVLYVAIESLAKVKFKVGHILYLLSVLILIVFTKRNIVFSNFNVKCVKKLKTSLFEEKKVRLFENKNWDKKKKN